MEMNLVAKLEAILVVAHAAHLNAAIKVLLAAKNVCKELRPRVEKPHVLQSKTEINDYTFMRRAEISSSLCKTLPSRCFWHLAMSHEISRNAGSEPTNWLRYSTIALQ